MKKEVENKELLIVTPFELPDVRLAVETIKAGAFPVLHLGRGKIIAEKSLKELSGKTQQPFGVCIVSDELKNIKLPENVTKVLLPFGINVSVGDHVEVLYQIHSLEEAQKAIKEKVSSIVIKGGEGAGKVAQESSFILFQGIINDCLKAGIKIYIQGGAGIHTSAAYLALGAQGVIFDSQIVAFPECSAPQELKDVCKNLSDGDIISIGDFKILRRQNSPKLPVEANWKDLLPFLGGYDISINYLPLGQDVLLASDFYAQYKKLRNLVYGFYEAAQGHLMQAKKLNIIGQDSELAKELGIKYPVAQGPMARVSDVPEFVDSVANAGALPFLALSVMRGETLKKAVTKTAELLKGKAWGIGVLGFAEVSVRDEQVPLILEAKPSVVIFSGGFFSLAKPYIDAGIKTFFHAPSTPLLNQYLKEGITNVIFEGRESGGHIGPLWSAVVWEKQINRLMQEEELTKFNVFFAGGIHDALSSAFVSVMSAGLAAQGLKVGILMGTAYLFTEEIVKTGAITPLYQKLAIETLQTVNLETVPGQVTRSIPTPFTEFFAKEKQDMQSRDASTFDLRFKLEDLNIGRARIASKGLERVGDKMVEISPKEQYEKGLYMIGEISVFNNKATTLEKLHKVVAVDNNEILSKLKEIKFPKTLSKPCDIAIVGIDCILPEANNIEEYWRNIVTAKDCVKDVPDIRWNKEIFYRPGLADTDYLSCATGGFVPTVDFDPMEFGMTPQSLASIEPLQLLSLLVANRALKNAGYDVLSAEDAENTSVIFSGEGLTDLASRVGFRSSYRQIVGELPEELKKQLPILNTDTFAGLLSNVTPGRISNRLNLKGMNYTVNSACASTLTALIHACQELRSYGSDIVVLGGDDFHSMLNDYLMFSSTHALSPRGYCASFDSQADGMTMGEGVGVAILKRLEDAERDGNRIYAVIKGVGGSSDGRGLGLTAPSKEGQVLAMQRAYHMSGISPVQVGLIEAHGTGTVVGDRTELRSTTSVFLNAGASVGQTYLGTVKSQIGHTKCAAGMSGLLRAIMSVYYGVIPPTIHLEKPLTAYDDKTSPFVFNTQAGIWTDEKRIAGISAFGFGGANAHAVIESYEPKIFPATIMKSWPSEIFVFRGDTLEEAKKKVKKVKTLIAYNDSIPLKNIAYSLATESDKDIQIIIIASSLDEFTVRIYSILYEQKEPGVYFRNEKSGKVAFLFSGQGSQRVNMARDLFVAFPPMKRLLMQNRELEKILFPHTLFSDKTKKELDTIITDTRNAQPLLGIVDFAIAEYLRFLGIEPDMLAGHSYGEIPALCFAGAFDPEKLVALSRERANSILNAVQEDTGKMIAISLPKQELDILLKEEKEVWAVNFNSPTQTVLAGSTTGMTAFMAKLSVQKIAYKELNVACAFHSPLLAKAKELYTDVLKDISFKNLQVPVWSNTTAGLYPKNADSIKERLGDHLIKPVLFSKEIEEMYADGARIFIETGPGSVLTGLTQSILGKDILALQTEAKGKEGITFLLHSLAQYLAAGKNFKIENLFADRDVEALDINEPEKYKRKKTVWRVNGQYAVPVEGKLPEVGGMPFEQPLGLKLSSDSDVAPSSNFVSEPPSDHSDKIILEYLDSVRSLIQNQRDVMLTYFGQNPQEFRPYQVEHQTPQLIDAEVKTSKPVQMAPERPQTVQAEMVIPSFTTLSTNQIKNTLLEVVSEKTGYPTEMLGLDLDLEGDLSIDSIKRMEIIGDLRDKLSFISEYANSEDAFIKMASIKTLSELITWIGELYEQYITSVPTIPQPKKTENASIQEQGQEQEVHEKIAQPNNQQTLSTENVKSILLEVVSDKTGYPVDMLGLDLDLEGDLSIDSIKRMEIIGDLRNKLNFTEEFENSEESFIKMASMKTLNELITWISEINEVVKPIESTHEKQISVEKVKDEPIGRLLLGTQPHPISSEKLSIQEKRFAITNDGDGEKSLTAKIKPILEKAGAQVEIIDAGADISSFNGLVLLNSATASKYYSIHDLFTLIEGKKLGNLEWLFTVTDLMAHIESKGDFSEVKRIQGFSGLLKTLHFEYPGINMRSIVFHTPFDAQTLPQIILDELTAKEGFPEIQYRGGERFRLDAYTEDIVPNETSTLPLNKDSVVLVLGGAQGISPGLIARLAKECPCHYILVGRSEQLEDPNGTYSQLKNQVDIRKHLITVEAMKVPTEIEKKIQKVFKSNQIKEAISKIEESGAKVTYKSLDITDKENFRMFLQSIRKEYGKIDGIIHAAGLLNDKFFADKTWKSFEQVYQTKVNPLQVIVDELNEDLKLLVLFSSVASTYGNKGQSDYTSANGVFDYTASVANLKPDMRILAINWGPWKGAGMVSELLEAEFIKRNVPLISMDKGGAYFVDELKYGKGTNVVVMGDKENVANFLKNLNT